jgi:hypothetical protein
MAKSISDFAVQRATTGNCDNPNPNGATPFAEYWEVRCRLVECCRRFGRTGPEDGWGDKDGIIFWIVDGQYNDSLIQRAQVYFPEAFSADWLTAIAEVLSTTAGWALSVNFPDGFLLVFPDRFVVSSPLFDGCSTLESLMPIACQSIAKFKEH